MKEDDEERIEWSVKHLNKLVYNQMGEGTWLALAVSLYNPEVALATFGGKTFSHAKYLEDLEDPEDVEYQRQLSEEDGNLVVITCVNTMSDDHNEHYVVIKISYCAEWGLKGYARVAFDFFDEILVPRLDQECKVRKRKKTTINNGGFRIPTATLMRWMRWKKENLGATHSVRNSVCL
ncbi:hypothetical protein Tco_1485543 [Tanacetum coccineum]